MKKVIIIIIAATCSLSASAQPVHEFSINGGGGLSALNYKLSSGGKKLGGGGEFGVGYTCLFTEQIGLHVGAGIGLYNAKADLDGAGVVTAGLTDDEGDRFNMHTTLHGYQETQNATFLNIPVMAHFQTGLVHKFYAMGGVKVGLPVSCKYDLSGATLTNEAYYPEYDNVLKEPTFAGYGDFDNISSSGKTKYKISAALALEAGMKWNIGSLLAVYTGAYFDYGLTNIAKETSFVNYNNAEPANFTINSAVASANKINVMAVGVKVRLALSPNGMEKSSGKEKTSKVKAEKPPKTKKPKSKATSETIEPPTADLPVEEIEETPVEVALTDAVEFTLGRPGREGFPATAMGITWVSNIDGQTAKFTTASDALVILPDQTAYNAITTQESLKEAFDAGNKSKEFTAKAGTSFKSLYLIVQDGETLYLIEMTSLQFKAGESKAYFRVKR
ncbi:MAG: PorT family protein [Bacteroidales bacterium]|nr:PorT family protein [Bacteroidales bacterium]